jgi:hypothetical protein
VGEEGKAKEKEIVQWSEDPIAAEREREEITESSLEKTRSRMEESWVGVVTYWVKRRSRERAARRSCLLSPILLIGEDSQSIWGRLKSPKRTTG